MAFEKGVEAHLVPAGGVSKHFQQSNQPPKISDYCMICDAAGEGAEKGGNRCLVRRRGRDRNRNRERETGGTRRTAKVGFWEEKKRKEKRVAVAQMQSSHLD